MRRNLPFAEPTFAVGTALVFLAASIPGRT